MTQEAKPATVKKQIDPIYIAEAVKFLLYSMDNKSREKSYKDQTDANVSELKSYSSLRTINWKNDDEVKRLKGALSNAFSEIKYPFKKVGSDTGTYKIDEAEVFTGEVKPGRVLVIDSKKYYLVTSVEDNKITTFPELVDQGKDGGWVSIDDKNTSYKIETALRLRTSISMLRPFNEFLNDEQIANIKTVAKQIFPELARSEEEINRQTISSTNFGLHTDHFLQIGDITLAVDPIQISFSTANGYQYFPTLRTAGNPKIPTLQQVKDISITLIFPNQDAINYQLLNLFAMFKRTPFVNIRNVDIVEFFKEISVDQSYISVALESINVQSVEGFPNTLQAQITLLPFDPRSISTGFSALKSMGDVLAQQVFMYRDVFMRNEIAKSERMINEDSIMSTTFTDIVEPRIDKTYDFNNSIPFRSFYQALIAERRYVTDEFGNAVKTNMDNLVDTTPFKPINDKNFLHEYREENNRIPVAFTYRYFDGDTVDVAKLVSKERQSLDVKKAKELREFMDTMNSKQNLFDAVVSTFYNTKDFYQRYTSKLNEGRNIIKSFLARQGLDVDPAPAKDITNLFEFIGEVSNPLNTFGIRDLTSSVSQIVGLVQGDYSAADKPDVLKAFNTLILDQLPEDAIHTGVSVTTARSAIENIYAWMGNDTTRKGKFKAFLEEMGSRMRDELNNDLLTFDPERNDFKIQSLPLKSDTVVVDNINDVITGWNIQFANKFTPMHLSAYRYPFYQHMGSEDISLSLSITSALGLDTNNLKALDLKTKLSKMSDRLSDTAKIVTLAAPELVSYLDPRLAVTTSNGSTLPDGNLFRVFGVDRVVYNSSNSTNINGQPNVWNTNLSLTQANFTLQEYHSIESLDSLVPLKDEIAALLSSIEMDETGNIKVWKYQELEIGALGSDVTKLLDGGLSEDESTKLKNYIETITSDDRNKLYKPVRDLETITRCSYLYSKYGEDLLSYIKAIKSGLKTKANEDVKTGIIRVQNKIKTNQKKVKDIEEQINKYGTSLTVRDPATGSEQIQRLKSEIKELEDRLSFLQNKPIEAVDNATNNRLIGAKASDKHIKDMNDILGNFFRRVEDKEASVRLQELINTSSTFSRIIRLIVSEINNSYKVETEGMKSIIEENKSVWTHLSDNYKKNIIPNLTNAGNLLIAGGGALTLAFIVGGSVAGVALSPLIGALFALTVIVFASSVIVTLAGSLFKSGADQALDATKKRFSEFFSKIIQDIRRGTIDTFAKDVMKDPVILNKFVNSRLISSTGLSSLSKFNRSRSSTNCYNDFDFSSIIRINPNDASSEVRVTPDFYLYNYRLSDKDTLEYINESLERYINIGKLTTMQGLLEYKDALDQFSKIEESLGQKAKSDAIHSNVRRIIFDTTDSGEKSYDDLIKEINSAYRQSTFHDVTWTDQQDKENADKVFTESDRAKYLADWEKAHPYPGGILGIPFVEFNKTPQQREWERERAAYIQVLNGRSETIELDPDKFKINMITAARSKALIELYEIYVTINNYLSDRTMAEQNPIFKEENAKRQKDKQELVTKINQSVDSLTTLSEDITAILQNAESESTQSKTYIEKIKPKLGKAGNVDKTKAALPDIVTLENYMYTKIAYFIRLNNAVKQIKDAQTNRGAAVTDAINQLPELRFLQYWGLREKEATIHRLETTKDFMHSRSKRVDTTLRMFPTCKLYFIEEDTGKYNEIDDYYVYNAIQSIEVTSNKNSPSMVARIRVSNVTGTLTDRLSLLRERNDFMSTNTAANDNVFFGTLDIKPGTSIMIKLGYAANDSDLPIVFIGRIMEMNVGPIMEIIAQSYSAQLNHELLHEKFGFWGSIKGHGDVATSTLDMIPGMEKLGKSDHLAVAKGFSGKNLNKQKGTLGDRFFLTNLLGSVNALTFAQDNPRDANIYLPYDLVDSPEHKMNFDWVIYNQSVWEVLQELSLYHKNARVLTRLYNDDSLSLKQDTRETIIVGDKAGYYKYTDSFAFTSKDYVAIEKQVKEFEEILNACKTLSSRWDRQEDRTQTGYTNKSIFNFPIILKVFKLLVNKTGVLVFALHLLRNTTTDASGSIMDNLVELIGEKLSIFNKEVAKQISNAMFVNQNFDMEFDNITDTESMVQLSQQTVDQSKAAVGLKLIEIVEFLRRQVTGANPLPTTLVMEDFYIVNPLVKNTDESLVYKPNYKKIQQHHLVTDSQDIISNNISLSSDFSNAINLYYPHKENITTLDGLSDKDLNSLNVWRIKAFGATSDDHTRPLNTFQKNIDLSWYEVNRAVEGFFKGYQKFYDTSSNSRAVSNWVTKGDSKNTFDADAVNLDVLPAFWTVGINLLQREVERMYQGTLELVGTPNIKPFDIVHIQDYMNDMHGTVEVEEVTHTFTPDGGFRTTIVPNLIAYDRNPVQMQDVDTIGRIYDFATTTRNAKRTTGLVVGGLATVGAIAAGFGGYIPAAAVLAGIGLPSLWNGTVGVSHKYHRFLYDQLGQIIGRDCINFSTLIYHNAPYIAGFDGVDYTSLKTLINYKVDAIQNPIARYTAFTDPFAAVVSTSWDPSKFGITGSLKNMIATMPLVKYMPLISQGFGEGIGNYNSDMGRIDY